MSQQTISTTIIRDAIKNNLTATAAPAVTDSTSNGYTLGSV